MKPTKKNEALINRVKDAIENFEVYKKLPVEMERMMKNDHIRKKSKKL